MATPPLRVERRVCQRFPYVMAVSLRQPAISLEGVGFTQDLSSRGVFFFTDTPLTEGSEIELTLRMPSEITLGPSMPVRCRGHVLRVVPTVTTPFGTSNVVCGKTKIGVAARLDSYEYLAEPTESSAAFARISTLHTNREEDQPRVHNSPGG